MPSITPCEQAFLAQSIERLRSKLIDLSKKNPLISFKHSERGASFVRVVDEDPDALYRQLRMSTMTFEPLPDPEAQPADERTPEFKMALERAKRTDKEHLKAVAELGEAEVDEEKADEIDRRLRTRVRAALGLPGLHAGGKLDIPAFAKAHGFDPGYELACNTGVAAKHLTDNKIRVLHTKSRLEARLRTIADRARSDAAEFGIHTLHMAFGFIEWSEDDASAVLHHAPLLLLPVALSRKHERGHYVYRLSAADEEFTINFALTELLRQKFAVELPKLAEEDTPGSFFDKVTALLSALPRLCLRRFVTIAIVRFHGMALWRDLDATSWPDATMLNHATLALLLGARGSDHGERSFPQDYPIEDEQKGTKPPPVLILPADSSQHSALVDALSGQSLAIEGPPGTGKSQTIANLIAAALDEGKRVLFCAEKRAALDVVAKRLEERGFGPLMLELHSDRASKAEVIASLTRRENARAPDGQTALNQKRQAFRHQRDTLRRYLSLLRQPVGELGQPVNALLWRALKLRKSLTPHLPPRFCELSVDQPARITATELAKARQALDTVEEGAARIEESYGNLTSSPWHSIAELCPTPFGQDKTLLQLGEVLRAADDLLSFAKATETRRGFRFPLSCQDAERWLAAWAALPRIGLETSPDRLRTALLAPDDVRRLCKLLRAYHSTFSSVMADLEQGAVRAAHLEQVLRTLLQCTDAQLWEPAGAQALKLHAARLADAGPFDRVFGKTYKASRGIAQAISLDRSLDRFALAELMRKLAAWQEAADAFKNDPRMRRLFGERWAAPGIRGVHNAAQLIEQAKNFLRTPNMTGLEALLASTGAGERTTETALEQILRLHLQLRVPPDGRPFWFWYSGPAEDPDALERALSSAAAIDAAGLPDEVRVAVHAADDPRFVVDDLIKRAEKGRPLIDDLHQTWAIFCSSVKADPTTFIGGSPFDSAQWGHISARLRAAREDRAGMRLHAEFLKYLKAVDEAGLRFVFDAFLPFELPVKRLADAYELLVVEGLLKQFLQADGGSIQEIGGATLTRAREQFRELDAELYRLEAERIVGKRLNDTIPGGIDYGPVAGWTEHALIKRELRKQNHIPLRQLIARAPAALQAMKPVWLMSPLSVAQYLVPGAASFDMVIIDEASQMKPEFAVGSIARAAQIIVVGDPKQLPPTDFFQAKAPDQDSDDQEEADDADIESILDLALARLDHVRRLRWHYRSRHASLIAFSNRTFYDRELVVFPNPAANDDLLGVKHVYVGGSYENRMNEREAEAVIDKACSLIYARPELSIGIVTMNSAQRDLIFSAFERIVEDDAEVREYVEKREKTIEPFFIKNLENVQGDERDIIIISTLWGPAPEARKVVQRFWPINSKTGHRRLNVLLTRAKRATIVVTSLKPTDIVLNATSSRGVRALRGFLDYAAGGAVVDDAAGGEPDSDFEEFVADRLRAAGYSVVPQVGVEGFRIDLGVKHPDYPGSFIAGIECDGARYHSGLTVRDRDRIRQDVLEGLGWRIYRVWSTDWFNDDDHETERLLHWLDEQQQAAAAAYAAAQEPASEASSGPYSDASSEPHAETRPHPGAEPEMQAAKSADKHPPASTSADAGVVGGSLRRRDGVPSTVTPEGRRHRVDDIDFYEPWPGHYDVWISGQKVGEVERMKTGLPPSHALSRPQYQATFCASDEWLNYENIYDAVRAVARTAWQVLSEERSTERKALGLPPAML